MGIVYGGGSTASVSAPSQICKGSEKKSNKKGNNEGNMREHVRTGWGDGYGQKDRDLLLADS